MVQELKIVVLQSPKKILNERIREMLEELKKRVYEANMELPKRGLVVFTWGNVSGIDRTSGLIAIKPSGVEYDDLTPDKIVLVNFNGEVVEGSLKPSSDTATHIELYKEFKDIGGVVHTHSEWATSFAQAGKSIKPYGLKMLIILNGKFHCNRIIKKEEVIDEYEKNTGKVIVETFANKDPNAIPAVLVNEHGPFTWGATPEKAVYHSVVLDEVAKMAFRTQIIRENDAVSMQQLLLDKHFLRKHGANAYYGQ